MYEQEWRGNDILVLKFLNGTNAEEAALFLKTLKNLKLRRDPFVMIIETDGNSPLPTKERKAYGAWWRLNRSFLQERCAGIARIAGSEALLEKFSSKAMQAFTPTPLLVTGSYEEAFSWAQAQLQGVC